MNEPKYPCFEVPQTGVVRQIQWQLKAWRRNGLALIALGVASLAIAAEPPKLKASPQPARPAQAAPQSAQVAAQPAQTNPITQAAVRSGVLACAGRIDQVSNFLTANSQSGAFLFMPQDQKDRQVFSTSMEIAAPNTPLAYASASYAPNQANGCGALYETVVFWSVSCEEVAAKQYAGLKAGAKMGQQTTVLVIGASARVFLMPAADRGCVAIKKEVVF